MLAKVITLAQKMRGKKKTKREKQFEIFVQNLTNDAAE